MTRIALLFAAAVLAPAAAIAASPVRVELVTPLDAGAALRPVAAQQLTRRSDGRKMPAAAAPLTFQGMPRFEPATTRATKLCIDWTTVSTIYGKTGAAPAAPTCWPIKKFLGMNAVPEMAPISDFDIQLTAPLQFQ